MALPPCLFLTARSSKQKRQVRRTIKVSWTKVKEAKGYELYRALPGKAFQKIKTVKSASLLTYADKDRKSNTSYYLQAEGVQGDKKGKKVYGRYSWSVRGDAGLPQEVNGPWLEASGEKGIGFYWSYDGKADGCYIYRSESEDGDFSLIDNVTEKRRKLLELRG